MAVTVEPAETPYIERQTLCMGGSTQGVATHAGEDDFAKRLRRNYPADESNVAEQLIHLKEELLKLDGEAFWSKLLIGMTDICRAQFAFVSKRVLVDDQTTPVEMPKIGEVGSCLMASALYYNNGTDIEGLHQNYKYHAWSCPCSHMKHDKVFLVPEGLSEFIGPNNPNPMAFPCDAYLGVPLFGGGKCFAHFGMMWTTEGVQKKRGLSWAFIEMFMHALEDLITKRLLAGQTFAKPENNQAACVIPEDAVTATQSLKAYARSLSHELRTPMQGVVGMLDLMYATVQEQIEGDNNSASRNIFRSLKENIEVVQDSSKRAIEAADNVVLAYDLNMQVPKTPSEDAGTPSASNHGSYFDSIPNMLDGSQIVNPHKRKRSMGATNEAGSAPKFRRLQNFSENEQLMPRSPLRKKVEYEDVSPKQMSPPLFTSAAAPTSIAMPKPQAFSPLNIDTSASTPGFRLCSVREVLPIVLNESLRTGGRPDFAVAEPIERGERIEVKTRSSNGESSCKIVTWSVDQDVPETVSIDERDLSKLVGAVFLNALKFTDEGEVNIHAHLSQSKRSLLISISDTGSGIPEEFKPELFKAFSKDDFSLTRTKEGLGLGLMVAKGLARRIGGDLNLVWSTTEGPQKGSEFEIRLPLVAGDTTSRSTTPFRSTLEDAPRSVPPTKTPASPRPQTLSPPLRQPSPLVSSSPSRANLTPKPPETPLNAEEKQIDTSIAEPAKPSMARRMSSTLKHILKPDRQLAQKYPLTFLVAEDNKINRKLLVQMLNILGYKDVHEAYDGKEAVRIVKKLVNERKARKRKGSNIRTHSPVDVILMDLWMPELDGYQATEQILAMFRPKEEAAEPDLDTSLPVSALPPTVLAVSADVTDTAIDKATKIGMAGYMSKPFKVLDLQKLILEFCAPRYTSAYPAQVA